jgi:hypothetical protein
VRAVDAILFLNPFEEQLPRRFPRDLGWEVEGELEAEQALKQAAVVRGEWRCSQMSSWKAKDLLWVELLFAARPRTSLVVGGTPSALQ